LSQSQASDKSSFSREPSNDETAKGKNNYSDTENDHYFEANYTQPLKQHLIEMGIANTRRASESESNYSENVDTSSAFDFAEDVKGAYLSLKLKFNRWSITTAERWETATMQFSGYSGGSVTNTYSYWIPNVMLSRQLSKNSLLRAGYSQRVTRPDISYLDPFVNNTDAFNIRYGNPMLKPTLSHVVNLTFNKIIRKFFFSINASHQFTENSIEQIVRIGSDTISRTTYENTGRYSSSTASLSINAQLFKKINLNVNGAANHVQFSESSDLKSEKHSGITYNAAITATANLKKWGLAANANYVSPLVSVQGSTTTFFTNGLTVSRHFLAKNNLTASLSASEPFVNRRISISEYNSPQFLIIQRAVATNMRLNLSLNYRFAKIKTE
jgi:ferric enterobactin receptor